MFGKDLEMERKVAKCKATLIKELNTVYKQLQKDGDWGTFGERIRGIYISYSTCDNEVYHRAMRDVLAGAAKNDLSPEITGGNYGLRVQAIKLAEEDLKIAQDMVKRYGASVAKRYLSSLNPCQLYAVCMSLEESKNAAKSLETLNKIIANQVNLL